MIEQFKIGKVSCDFIAPDDFFNQCRKWLVGDSLRHVVTLNPEMIMEAETNEAFAISVNSADIRVHDGAGLVWAKWYIRSSFWSLLPSLLAFPFVEVERITGIDTLLKLSKICADEKKSVYLLGGTASQNKKTELVLKKLFPNLNIFTSANHLFDITGPEKILSDITEKKPDVLFVAYGAPKQTIWIEQHREKLNHCVKIAIGVGGAFAILSEERPRAPWIFRRLNIEWLWRLFLEPSRLPRIWQATVNFPILVRNTKQKTLHDKTYF